MLFSNLIASTLISIASAAPFPFTPFAKSPAHHLEKRATNSWPATVVAPFCDVLLWPTYDINAAAAATGSKYFTLAFITADSNGNPAWGASVPLAQNWYLDKIATLRASGGDVIISFGGAIGVELAVYHTDVGQIQAAYQSVIDTYKVTWVDFDIEGGAITDTASNTRRAQALVGLKQANPGLIVSYTLPVLPTGLTSTGSYVLAIAAQNKLTIDVVNIMAMDYGGPSVAPNGNSAMGDYAIQAAKATYQQAQTAGLTNFQIGITPMIGQNDGWDEIFQLDDAKKLLTFAQQTSWVRFIGFWSVNRDTSVIGPLYASTQIVQTDHQFLSIFAPFTGSATSSGSGGSTGGSIPPIPKQPGVVTGYNWPTKTFAPFVDVTISPTFDIVTMAYKTGVVNYVLSHIVSGSNGQPSWGGNYDLSWYTASIQNIRQFGGDVIISFGGASGQELALTSTSVNALQGHYQDVIDSYAINWVDFDIQGSALKDKASIDRRSQALRALQVADPNIIISFTLPVTTTGLTSDGLALLQSALTFGVRVDLVNINAKNFGTSNGLGQNVINAAATAHTQLYQIGLTCTQIGLTPMIGQNNILTDYFQPADATAVTSWAQSQNYVGLVSFWDANRDNAQKSSNLAVSSNIAQTNYQFSSIFSQFAN